MRVLIEGDVLHHHSLAQVNRAIALGLDRLGWEVMLRQRNDADQLDRWNEPEAPRIYDMLDRDITPDVIFRHAWPPDLARPQYQAPVVFQQFWEYGSIPNSWRYGWAQLANHVISGSRYVTSIYEQDKLPVPVTTIPPGVGPEFLRDYKVPKHDRKIFLFVGGTIVRKGIDVLLDAWDKAFTKDDPVELWIKDHPFYHSDISGRIEQMRAPVRYIREMYDPSEMPLLYAQADVFVFPSRGEGFGLPLVEAMAQGLTIIAPRHTGLADYLPEDALEVPCKRSDLAGEQLASMNCVRTPYCFEPDTDALVDLLRSANAPTDRHRYHKLLPSWDDAIQQYDKVLRQVATETPIFMINNLPSERSIGMVPRLVHRKEFDQAIAVDGTDPGIYQQKAMYLLEQGQLDPGLQCLDEAVKISGRDINCLVWRGRVYLSLWHQTKRNKFLLKGCQDLIEAGELEPTIPLGIILQDVPIPAALRQRYDAIKGKRRTISAVMICRNEEENLPRSLGSIKPYVDEVIVVDTGSTDESMRIAKTYGKVIDRRDLYDEERHRLRSFAEARNAALDAATCETIFWLDADDEVTPQVGVMLRRLAQHPEQVAGSFPVSCPQRGDAGQESENRVRHYRFFPNIPSIRFEGPIHEQVAPAIAAAGIPVVAVDTPIKHHGYLDPEVLRSKYERNLTILLDHDNGSDWDGFNLMTTWLLKGDAQKAVEYGEDRLEKLNLNQAHAGKYLSTLAGALIYLGNVDRAIEISEKGLESGSNVVEHCFNLGGIYLKKAREGEPEAYEKAEHFFLRCLSEPIACRGGAIDIEAGTTKPLTNLAHVYLETKQLVQARKAFLQLLSLTDMPYARAKLVEIYKELKDQRAADRHAKLLSDTLDREFESRSAVGQQLLEMGNYDAALQIYQKLLTDLPGEAGAALNVGIVYNEKGDYETATDFFLRSIATKPSADAFLHLARSRRLSGDYESAMVAADTGLEGFSTDGALHHELGMVCIHYHLWREGLRCLQMASMWNVNIPEGIAAAAVAHYHAGKSEDALEMARRAMDLDPKVPGLEDVYDGSLIPTAEICKSTSNLSMIGSRHAG